MDEGADPYKILGVSTIATDVEIRKAYRKLAIQCHPDKQQDEESRREAHHKFAELGAAYELLMDPTQRRNYDESQGGWDRKSGKPAHDMSKDPEHKEDIGFRKKKFRAFHFSDPYEIFKRNFEEEFGFPYPGSKYDHVDPALIEQAKKLSKEQGRPDIPMLTDGREQQDLGGQDSGAGGGGYDQGSGGGGGGKNRSAAPDSDLHNVSDDAEDDYAGDGKPEEKKKKKGFLSKLFGKKDKKDKDKKKDKKKGGSKDDDDDDEHQNKNAGAPEESASSYPPPHQDSAALVVRDPSAPRGGGGGGSSTAVVPASNAVANRSGGGGGGGGGGASANKGPGSQLANAPGSAVGNHRPGKAPPTSNALTVHNGEEEEVANNRPISMETREIKIEHDDGRIETIEETTIKRPDGSTETFRRTDMPDSKTGNWKKKHEMLTNGEPQAEPKKMIEGAAKPKLAITDGGSKGLVPYQGTAPAKQKPLSIQDGPVGSRGLVPYKGTK